ncbi:MAG: hypothetical protein WCJ30_06290, partial [Deltaproteobacteria bacterium]
MKRRQEKHLHRSRLRRVHPTSAASVAPASSHPFDPRPSRAPPTARHAQPPLAPPRGPASPPTARTSAASRTLVSATLASRLPASVTPASGVPGHCRQLVPARGECCREVVRVHRPDRGEFRAHHEARRTARADRVDARREHVVDP